MIRSILVSDAQRSELARGHLVIVRQGESYVLVPRLAADKVAERDKSLIVLDHGQAETCTAANSDDDDYYKQFEVPDDLIW
jgi:hypothetical protein